MLAGAKMYYNGQIIHDIDNNRPFKVGSGNSTFAWDGYPKGRHTHYLEANGGEFPKATDKIWSGNEDIVVAKELLLQGKIVPDFFVDVRRTCWDCRNWLSNPPRSYCRSGLHAS